MIDEKKIEEAANKYVGSEPTRTEGCQISAERASFIDGANWAQQEFANSLWHDASEEPQRYDDYLVKTKQGCIDFCLFDINGWHNPKVGGGNVSKWLDLKDILPQIRRRTL